MKETSENRENRQRQSYAEECRVWAHENREAIASLKAKLFAIGGNKISPQPCPFVSEIASHRFPEAFLWLPAVLWTPRN
jgi:hypothetical protein